MHQTSRHSLKCKPLPRKGFYFSTLNQYTILATFGNQYCKIQYSGVLREAMEAVAAPEKGVLRADGNFLFSLITKFCHILWREFIL